MPTILLRQNRSDVAHGLFETVNSFFAGIAEGHEIAMRYQKLSRLSDGELAELGLDRTEVPQAAVRGVPSL